MVINVLHTSFLLPSCSALNFLSSTEGDLDGEDAYIRIKPEPIETYMQITKFSRRELQMMYRGFKQECPNGIVKEETFKSIYAHFFPRTSETDSYASYVYNSIDRAGPVVTFTELVLTLSALARGSLQDKLRWAFSLYDLDHDGILSRSDLFRVIMSIYFLLGRSNPDMYEKMAQDHADRVFADLDINGDGVITIEEFMDSCLRNQSITDSLIHFDTIL